MQAIDGFKIWQLDEVTWIWGTRFADAAEDCIKIIGMSWSEIFDDRDGEINSSEMELSEYDLDKLQFRDDLETENSPHRTFREELKRRIRKGEDTGMFATSEF